MTTANSKTTPSLFMEGYIKTIIDITNWGLAHPRTYIAVALAINAITISVGTAVGDWSMLGVLKFWLAATVTAMAIGTPTFKLAMWTTTEKQKCTCD